MEVDKAEVNKTEIDKIKISGIKIIKQKSIKQRLIKQKLQWPQGRVGVKILNPISTHHPAGYPIGYFTRIGYKQDTHL